MSEKLDEIAERATNELHTPGKTKRKPNGSTFRTVRAALAEADADVERLRALIDEADRGGWTVKGLKGAIAASRAKVANLEAEVERLRVLLHQSREVEGGAQTRVLDLVAEVESWTCNVDITGAELREAYAKLARLRAAGQRCMEISTGLAAAGIVGHMNILDVMGTALRGEGAK